jgi:uncharacterized protein YdeI (YjbR/CyaY-like superfamily)
MNPKVDWFFDKASKWQKEYAKLREIVLSCDLAEELKWGHPCYTYEKGNIVLVHGFKDYCALLFFKGVLLKDKKKILVQQTEHVQAARQIRFTDLREIEKLKATLKAYIYEAVEIDDAGLKVDFKKTRDFPIPDEFKKKLNKSRALKAAFESLTPGRQRGYLLHFSSAKQVRTREARVEKYLPKILEGKGLEDE